MAKALLQDRVAKFITNWAPHGTPADIRGGRKPRQTFLRELRAMMNAYGKAVLIHGTLDVQDAEDPT